MELRILKYFLAVAREESISGAAQALHMTQPTLSRQLMDLEEELGKQQMCIRDSCWGGAAGSEHFRRNPPHRKIPRSGKMRG